MHYKTDIYIVYFQNISEQNEINKEKKNHARYP